MNKQPHMRNAKSSSARSAHNHVSAYKFEALTPNLMFQLMAPHTFAPSILAVLFSVVYAQVTFPGRLSIILTCVLFLICTLMQAAANTLNDYFDYKKGTDSMENSSEDSFDAVLVYHKINPQQVLIFAFAQLAVAAALGAYVVAVTGLIPLVIGIIGAIVVVIYSAGKTPLSYLPIGEVAIGFVMGGLIPLACVYVLSGVLDWTVLLKALPLIVGIGMVLATNNTCDIEKDIEANRNTLAVTIGRANAVASYRLAVLIWMTLIILLEICFYLPGLLFGFFMLAAAFPVLRALLKNPLVQASRDGAMAQIISLNIIFITFYCLAIVMATKMFYVF